LEPGAERTLQAREGEIRHTLKGVITEVESIRRATGKLKESGIPLEAVILQVEGPVIYL
jgi:hypothetical protein